MENVSFDPKSELVLLPSLPGVYRMLDDKAKVLYVGKAIDLKRRVSSYFQKSDLSPRIRLMVRQVARIEITVTRSEAEALILENNLIKALAPKYNILFRDDKSYPYIKISSHTFPKIMYYRGEQKRPHQYFGPYPNSYAVRESLHILQKVFQLRTCEDSVFANRSRPCLLYQIKQCSAPCVGYISQKEYCDSVDNAIAFLRGKQNELIDTLNQRMSVAAEALEFEKAAQLRDQIQALSRIQEKQFVLSRTVQAECDVVAVLEQEGLRCVNVVMIRGGCHVGDKRFFPLHDTMGESLTVLLETFLIQHYTDVLIPGELLVNREVSTVVKACLSERAGRHVSVTVHPIGERRMWLAMAEKNAAVAIQQRSQGQAMQHHRLVQLSEVLALPGIHRLECFDISHTQGEATVASCVVYDKNAMQPSQYRRYNINTVTPGDDYAAMRELLQRRYGRLVQEQGVLPDVVLIDGGKGQVGVALEVWATLGLSLPIVGVAKGEERKPGLETLILPFQRKTLHLPSDHPALHLIQTIRDEAHRFAVSGHRVRRAKARTRSTLEAIPGVGAKRRQRLLLRFGGLKGVAAASMEDLAQVEGISWTLAEKIYHTLH